MKNVYWILLVSLSFVVTGCGVKHLSPKEQAQRDLLMQKIENRDFVFTANSAHPMNGKTVNLTSSYSLKIRKDTVSANLPYFGQSYNAPMNPSELGVDFLSVDFDYKVVSRKKDMLQVLIEPRDISNSDLRGIKLYMSTGASGYGSLRILFNQRQSISYNGTIE